VSNAVDKEKLVSVIMPLFNAEKTIKASVQSVLNQTYKKIELIIVDDHSLDLSFSIAKEIENKDARIKVLHLSKNCGAGVARNIGIKIAKGNYIAFLDADDQWKKEKIELQVDAFKKTNASLICSGYTIVDEDYNTIGKKQPKEYLHYKDLLRSNHIGCLTAIIGCLE